MSLIGDKMYWGLEQGPVKIWCKFGKDQLKTKGCGAHTRKSKLGPLVATNINVMKMYWVLEHGPKNIWCEFGKDQLKTKSLEHI